MQLSQQIATKSFSHTFAWLRIPEFVLVMGVFLLAVAPRILAPGDFWTADEAKHWSVRVDTFLPAFQEGNYAQTNLVGHPGVTTMWLGSFGVLLHQVLAEGGWVDLHRAALHRLFLRVPVAIVTALCIALSYPLLQQLFGKQVALMAVLLWIGDPFLTAHGKLLHVDGLLTSFITVSLLSLMVGLRLGHPFEQQSTQQCSIRWSLVMASAIAGGLALLTKSPSLILFPMVGLIALVGLISQQEQAVFQQPRVLLRILAHSFLVFLVWVLVASVTWVAIWPAAWVDPLGSAMTVLNEIFRNGAAPHGWGNFFMGQVVGDPGFLFYPVALDLRLTPWTMLGIFACAIALAPMQKPSPTLSVSALPRQSNLPLLLLLIFALTFIAIMSFLAKKFDRYILPAFPVIDLVAAFGLLWIGRRLAARYASLFRIGMGIVLIGAMIFTMVWYHPYELAYFNPVLGGGAVAQKAMYVGWGEGLEHAGQYIREQYNGCELGIASWYELVLQPYVCSPVLHQGYIPVPGHVHYAVLYVNQEQREIRPEIMPFIEQRGSLVYTFKAYGIDYVQVYQLRQPRQHEITADFGSSIRLTGYDVNTSAIRSTGVLTLTLQWQVREEMQNDYHLFVHVFDDKGHQVGQTDVPPGGNDQPTSAWKHGRFIDWIHRVPVQSDIPTDHLWVSIGLYDPQTFVRLPLGTHPQPAAGAPNDGDNAFFLEPVKPYESPENRSRNNY